jgi:AcrR family transcriptional regulator
MSARANAGTKPDYHHGNLKRALLDAALSLFAERGGFEFTFRELARAAGVTHNAPYRHFSSKAELLSALREEGLTRLAAASHEALSGVSHEPRERVRALGESYVRFALEHPLHFRLVLSHPLETGSGERAGGSESYALLEAALRDAQAAGVARADLSARELALAAWALVHGLASLLASGQLPASPARVRRYSDLLSTVFFDGAASKRPASARAPTRGRPRSATLRDHKQL